jgi:ribonuclease P/MRP protein subunit POP1
MDDVLKTLKLAASRALEALKLQPEHTGKKYSAEVANLVDTMNTFEIMGAKSSQVIHGALTPVAEGLPAEFRDVCFPFCFLPSAL